MCKPSPSAQETGRGTLWVVSDARNIKTWMSEGTERSVKTKKFIITSPGPNKKPVKVDEMGAHSKSKHLRGLLKKYIRVEKHILYILSYPKQTAPGIKGQEYSFQWYAL